MFVIQFMVLICTLHYWGGGNTNAYCFCKSSLPFGKILKYSNAYLYFLVSLPAPQLLVECRDNTSHLEY
jgi:hypothetical protein